ncbi:ATP-binding protein [Streptomyces sp. NBC_00257]|uniref:AAA family ATPase n=1 Tax=unclassified Streptomyces TaxID=2593676 RepID=UPI002255206D|nr:MULTISPECIES: ATP-binding protein [unclassified Streptomyces]MCX4869811.1 ATP-binding protein [Streptomyces sp. NBC_00906]MCX4900974.1 ATP-binding protein [Streptomyces sp. NBC_00892]MCX5426223.1 ATP-binding protein [Streptomyces sp. NBC_00062]
MPCKLVDEGQHAGRLEGRLQAARQRAFVGRKEELAAFEEALCTGGRVLFIHGPRGVGKSALLGRFAQRAAAADRTVLMLDGRSLEESPAAFVAEARAVQRLRAGHRTQRHRPRTHDARDGTPPRRLATYLSPGHVHGIIEADRLGRVCAADTPGALTATLDRLVAARVADGWSYDPGSDDITWVLGPALARRYQSMTAGNDSAVT